MAKTKTTLNKILAYIVKPNEYHLYIFVLILMTAIPFYIRPGLPMVVTPEARKFHDTMEALGPDDIIIFSWELGPEGLIGGHPLLTPLWKHLMMKPGLKIVFVTIRNTAATATLEIVTSGDSGSGGLFTKEGKYGEEYVYLGYIPGEDIAAAALAEDLWAAAGGVDYYGTPLSDLPIMANIRSHEDITLIIDYGPGFAGPWINQWTVPYDTVYTCVSSTVGYAFMLPWYEIGVITAILPGIVGSAEYEYMLGIPGYAIMSGDVLSLGAVLFITLVIIRNISYHIVRMRGGEE